MKIKLNLRDILNQKKLRSVDLSRLTDIPQNHISHYLAENRFPTFKSLMKMKNALNLRRVEDLIEVSFEDFECRVKELIAEHHTNETDRKNLFQSFMEQEDINRLVWLSFDYIDDIISIYEKCENVNCDNWDREQNLTETDGMINGGVGLVCTSCLKDMEG